MHNNNNSQPLNYAYPTNEPTRTPHFTSSAPAPAAAPGGFSASALPDLQAMIAQHSNTNNTNNFATASPSLSAPTVPTQQQPSMLSGGAGGIGTTHRSMTWGDGSKYTGEMLPNGQFHGFGQMEWKSGQLLASVSSSVQLCVFVCACTLQMLV